MTQEQKDLVINAVVNLMIKEEGICRNEFKEIWDRLVKKTAECKAVDYLLSYRRGHNGKDDAQRLESAKGYVSALIQCFKVRELDKYAKELEAAERERKQAALQALIDEIHEAEAAVREAAGRDWAVEAEARIEILRRADYWKSFYTVERRDALRALAQEFATRDKQHATASAAVVERLSFAVQCSKQSSSDTAADALIARVCGLDWVAEYIAHNISRDYSELAQLILDNAKPGAIEQLEAETETYAAARDYLRGADDRLLNLWAVAKDALDLLCRQEIRPEYRVEEAMLIIAKAAELESTEDLPLQDATVDAVEEKEKTPFPVAVEYLRDCFLKCYDDVQIYGYSMALTSPRCRLVKDEASEAWREVEDKYWEQFRIARSHNRNKGTCEGERQIAQEFAEAVLPLCKLDELKKLELDVEEEKKRAAICEECVEIEQRLRESAETKVEQEEARARIWYADVQAGWRNYQQRLDALRAIELCKEHKTASERVVKQLRAARESYDRDAFNALLERVNAPEWLRAYLPNNVSYGVLAKDAVQLMIDHCDVEKLEADEPTDEDFAIDPRDAYVETMKAVAVEDMEEPDADFDEYIKEYRAAHKETRARRLARSLRDFLWTRGFSLDDVGKAEWWQTVALRWPSLDEFVAVAKAGGLKNIDKYLRRGLRKANKRRAVRALLRIARAYAETCL